MAYVINYPRQRTQSDTTITPKARIHAPFLARFTNTEVFIQYPKFLNLNRKINDSFILLMLL